ncbi:MAG: FeoB-associated Cys-rich membrane protein [Lachnospiraceae bacterium]|nr:FeoB-associated Cys-rich membrane protein [Lachnospiraceae bacterium]
MGTFIVLLLVAGAAALAIRQMIKDKKAGKSISCGGDCSRCRGCQSNRKADKKDI